MSRESKPSSGEPKNPPPTPDTRWSVVLKAASGEHTSDARQALRQLCEMYWQTLYRVARKLGRNDDQACEAVQGFICVLLEGSKQPLHLADPDRGRFRSFLWTCFKGYLADEAKAATRQKRGGTTQIVSLDSRGPDGRLLLEPVDDLTPEDAFRKSLALDTFQAVLEELKGIRESKEEFDRLVAYLAKECRGDKARTLADQLGVSEDQARLEVLKFRQQFRKVFRRRVGEILSNPTESNIDSEVQWLWEGFCR